LYQLEQAKREVVVWKAGKPWTQRRCVMIVLISHHPFEQTLMHWGQLFLNGGPLIWARRRRWSPISGLHQDRRVIVILINTPSDPYYSSQIRIYLSLECV
jgi:hypothetical protein